MSHGGKRPQLPLVGGLCAGSGLWPLASFSQREGEGSFPGEARPWIRCLPHVQFPGAPPPLTTCPTQPCRGFFLDQPLLVGTLEQAAWLRPQADPARAKDLCHDFGQVILRVAGLRGDQNSEGRA